MSGVICTEGIEMRVDTNNGKDMMERQVDNESR